MERCSHVAPWEQLEVHYVAQVQEVNGHLSNYQFTGHTAVQYVIILAVVVLFGVFTSV